MVVTRTEIVTSVGTVTMEIATPTRRPILHYPCSIFRCRRVYKGYEGAHEGSLGFERWALHPGLELGIIWDDKLVFARAIGYVIVGNSSLGSKRALPFVCVVNQRRTF